MNGGFYMDEQQYQHIIGLLKENKKNLKIIQFLVGFMLGLTIAIYIAKLF
jgi:hypothetical protein